MMLARVAGLHVGSVETCSPTEIKVLLDPDAPQDMAFNSGRPQGFPRLNGYVLIPNEGGTVVAVINRMTMEPAPAAAIAPGDRVIVPVPVSRRRLFVTPLGALETRRSTPGKVASYSMVRGVASYPAVGDAVVLPTPEQLKAIVEASGSDRRVLIGHARLALDAPVTVDPDKVFGRHIGVFGNTGSGKSCTVAGLIRWSVEAAGRESGGPVNARFIVLDPNGEYRTCFMDLADRIEVRSYSVEPAEGETQLSVPAWMWNGQEWSGALNASPGAQRPVLMQAIRQLRNAALVECTHVAAGASVLLATQVRAFVDWLQSSRAEGVGALGYLPRIRAMHENLQGLEDQLTKFSQGLDEEQAELAQALSTAIERSRDARARRTDNRGGNRYLRQFQDNDLSDIVEALNAVRRLLPDVAIAAGATEDTPARFDVEGLPGMINLLAGLQGGNVQQHMAGLDLRVRTLLSDTRITPIIAPEDGGQAFGEWLGGIFGEGTEGRGQITIIDLSLVPSDVLTTVVSVLGRLVFETAQRYRRQHHLTIPTVLVLEEAHNFVQRQTPDSDDTGPAVRCRSIFEKIAKEGRKYGVGLVLSSQRPAELSPTIVAQCNSFILHRIVNDRDQELVSRLAPDSSGTLLKELPSLPTQKAILLGIATEIPIVFDVRPLQESERPSSANPDFWNVWTGKRAVEADFNRIAGSWSS